MKKNIKILRVVRKGTSFSEEIIRNQLKRDYEEIDNISFIKGIILVSQDGNFSKSSLKTLINRIINENPDGVVFIGSEVPITMGDFAEAIQIFIINK